MLARVLPSSFRYLNFFGDIPGDGIHIDNAGQHERCVGKCDKETVEAFVQVLIEEPAALAI